MSDEDIRLLPIGAIARATNLTVKALRHYHEIGLLIPRSVDAWTGYRGYGPEELARAAMIATLRRLELPLAEMATVLADPGSEEARSRLRAHRARLSRRSADLDVLLARLDAFLEGRTDMEYPATLTPPAVRVADPRTAAALTATTTIERLATLIPDLLQQVTGALAAAGVAAAGPVFARYLDNPQTGEPFRMEVGVPIATDRAPAPLVTVTLPGGRHIVAEHRGAYDTLPESWAGLFRFVLDGDHEIDGGPWEVYLRTPMDSDTPSDWRTELVFPLRDGSSDAEGGD